MEIVGNKRVHNRFASMGKTFTPPKTQNSARPYRSPTTSTNNVMSTVDKSAVPVTKELNRARVRLKNCKENLLLVIKEQKIRLVDTVGLHTRKNSASNL